MRLNEAHTHSHRNAVASYASAEIHAIKCVLESHAVAYMPSEIANNLP